MPTVNSGDFEQLWFTNLVDHFDFQNDSTYEQRYWVNDKYWTADESGPNFVYICGEYTCSIRDDRLYPFMVGAEYGARLYALEHRFYGSSQPFDDWSLDSYRWLSSEQAMSDLAYFIAKINEDQPDRPTIVIGGSYPGALSAWFRAKYPHAAVAAWSASGVVQPIVDYWQYDEQVYTSTAKSGEWCPKKIFEINAYATQEAALRLNGFQNAIDEVLKGTGAEEMRTDDFMSFLADAPAGNVQYGTRTILCDEYIKPILDLNLHDSFISVVNTLIASGDDPLGYDSRPGSDIVSEKIDVTSAGRSWTYQTCAEYGWFQTPSEVHPLRSQLVKLEYYIDLCKRVFPGLNMDNKPHAWESIADQGGFDIAGTNIFFTNGGEDPW